MATMPAQDIKTMKLYSDIERLDTELAARGYSKSDPLTVQTVQEVDSMHYQGVSAVAASATALDITAGHLIFDIGSGFGGPARYLAANYGAVVTALELQPDVHAKAAELTRRCSCDLNNNDDKCSSNSITHVQGDILHIDLDTLGQGPGSYHGIVSWLTFLHISDKKRLFERCHAMLRQRQADDDDDDKCSAMVIDDYFQIQPFTAEELLSLQRDVYCYDLPTKEAYTQFLQAAGFTDIQWLDMTTDWTAFCSNRLHQFKANKSQFVDLHSAATYDKLLEFYTAVATLFNGGNLGGVRILARKK
jgi:cyclopropane fatty-acyl-phospholipid synthase-like methyltransferase